MNIELNFIEDVRADYGARLQAWGYALPPPTGDATKDTHRICVDYWNAKARRIPVQPRAVLRSAELLANEPSLSLEIRQALTTVEQEILKGADLTPRLSRSLKKRKYNDKMLHDWGIHHLHLGDVVEGDGFIERTDDLLFVLRRPDTIYLLDVRPHGAWTDEDLVEIVHANWPDTIRQYRLVGVSASPLSADQRKNLRDKNANAGVETRDGTFYMAIGGGLVCSGSNVTSIRWADLTIATARSLEDVARKLDVVTLVEQVATFTGARPIKLELKLGQIEDDHAFVVVANATSPDGNPFVIRVNYN